MALTIYGFDIYALYRVLWRFVVSFQICDDVKRWVSFTSAYSFFCVHLVVSACAGLVVFWSLINVFGDTMSAKLLIIVFVVLYDNVVGFIYCIAHWLHKFSKKKYDRIYLCTENVIIKSVKRIIIIKATEFIVMAFHFISVVVLIRTFIRFIPFSFNDMKESRETRTQLSNLIKTLSH